jgi:hypothetical protein
MERGTGPLHGGFVRTLHLAEKGIQRFRIGQLGLATDGNVSPGLSDLPDGPFSKPAVKPRLQKYSVFRKTQITSIFPAVPSHRGALRNVTKRGAGCGGRC